MALHIGLCAALAAFVAFSSVFRAILAADSGGTYLCVLGIYLIFTILQGIIMRSHKTPEAFANLPAAGGVIYAILVIIVNLLMPGESPSFGGGYRHDLWDSAAGRDLQRHRLPLQAFPKRYGRLKRIEREGKSHGNHQM